ncbi:MAG: MATE family efflux transporter [Erysipelotrichaceae bacterium]|nr:MATE family efflux transporter [Erysipelotrichaceae bacterium]
MDENINTIGKDFTLTQLIAFTAGPVFTNLLVSVLQTLDDSLFISRYCGQDALAAFSVSFPFFMLMDAIGMVLSAVSVGCSIKMGQKKNDEANSDFTTVTIITFLSGLAFSIILFFFGEPILRLMGETDILMPYALTYVRISLYTLPLLMTGYVFSRFYVIAGKPQYAVITTAMATFINLFFDWLFIVVMKMGIAGTALANSINYVTVFVFSMFVFANPKQEVHFVKPESKIWPLLKSTFLYGRSQFITSLSISVNGFIANNVQLALGGEVFVAAYTIVTNVQWLFMNSYFAFLGTVSPIVSYAYGEKNAPKLSKTFRQIFILVTLLMIMIVIIFVSGKDLIMLLYLTEESNPAIRDIINYGVKIVPYGFLFFGYNVMVQELATSVGNTKTSMILSMIQHILVQNVLMLAIPYIFGVNGIWFVFTVTQIITLFFSLYVINAYKDVYGYGRSGIATFVNE